MSRPHVPPAVLDAAHARRAARIARDWPEADRLRAVIEAAGWRVVDRGADFALEPAHPADLVEDGHIRYGSSDGVPSRMAEPDAGRASLIVLGVGSRGEAADMTLAWLASVPADVQRIVVVDDPPPGVLVSLDVAVGTGGGGGRGARADGAGGTELLATSAPLGPGACLNMALRRAAGTTLVVVTADSRPVGDVIAVVEGPVGAAGVAAVGADGLTGRDAGHLVPADPGDIVALTGRCLAVRRSLAVQRGPVDERFATWPQLAAWWTLLLRDEGEGEPPLRARFLPGLPLADAPPDGPDDPSAPGDPERPELERQAKRDRYRLIRRFGNRPDLFARSRPR